MPARLKGLEYRKYLQSEFLRNTLKLVFGTGIAQLISILVSPVLTRIYSPADFGLFSFFISIAGGFALVATLRYELAIIFPKEETDAVNVLGMSTLIAFGLSILLLLGVVAWHFISLHLGMMNPLLDQWLFLLPLLVFLLGCGNIFQNWFIRKKEFRVLSVSRIVNSVGNNSIIIILGLVGTGAWGLVIGNISGTVLFVLFLFYFAFRSDRQKIHNLNRTAMKVQAKIYKDLPTSNTLQAILEMMQNYGIIYLAKIFFSSTIVGLYALAMRILQAPLWLIGSAISQVFMKDVSDRRNEEIQFETLIYRTIKFAGIVASPLLILLLVAGPWLFGVIFGPAWRESGVYARILAPWMFFDFIRYSVAQTPLIVGRTRSMFHLSLIGTGFMVFSLILGGLVLHDVRNTFILLSLLMSLYAIGVVVWIRSLARHGRTPGETVQ